MLSIHTYEGGQVHERLLDLGDTEGAKTAAEALGWYGLWTPEQRLTGFSAHLRVLIEDGGRLRLAVLPKGDRLSPGEFRDVFALTWKNPEPEEVVPHALELGEFGWAETV